MPSAVRPEVQQSLFPSGEKTGRPSKPSVNVMRTGSFAPLASVRKSSKFAKPSLFAVKMRYSPVGWKYESYLLDRTLTVKASPTNNFTLNVLFDDAYNMYVQTDD